MVSIGNQIMLHTIYIGRYKHCIAGYIRRHFEEMKL